MMQTDTPSLPHQTMEVLPLEHESDFKTVLGWFAGYDIPGVEGWLSDTGFWVPGICAGWLYLTNSKRAYLEDFVTNKAVDRDTRYAAMFRLEAHIARVAKETYGAAYLAGMTRFPRLRDGLRQAGYHISEPHFSLHGKVL